MDDKQILLAFVIVFLILITIFGITYYAKKYELNLPELGDIESIILESTNKKSYTDETGKKDILTTLKGKGRSTKSQSIQDSPVEATNEIKIDFILKTNLTSTLYVYMKNNKYYIEQPYNGIYEITIDEYNSINSYLVNKEVE